MNHAHKTSGSTVSHGSLTSYCIGFVLSLAFTFGAFYAATLMHGVAVIGIVIAAVLQLIVQLVFFLHFGRQGTSRSHQFVFWLTLFIISILVVGTLWIMANLDRLHQHMPGINELYQNGTPAPQNELK